VDNQGRVWAPSRRLCRRAELVGAQGLCIRADHQDIERLEVGDPVSTAHWTLAQQLPDVQLGDVAVELEVGHDPHDQQQREASGQRDGAPTQPWMAVSPPLRLLNLVSGGVTDRVRVHLITVWSRLRHVLTLRSHPWRAMGQPGSSLASIDSLQGHCQPTV